MSVARVPAICPLYETHARAVGDYATLGERTAR